MSPYQTAIIGPIPDYIEGNTFHRKITSGSFGIQCNLNELNDK